MNFTLLETGSGTGIHHVAVNGGPVIVGRSLRADVYIDDPWVSRCHCEISQVIGMLVVRDNSARNGTYVNGMLVRESHLHPGDRLRLGMTTFTVEYQHEGVAQENSAETTWSDGTVGANHAKEPCAPFASVSPLIG